MRNWIHQRKNQVFILMIGISIVLLSNVIHPKREKRTYHQQKTTALKQRYHQLHRFALHTSYHLEQQPQREKETASLEKRISDWSSTKTLQKRLGAWQRQHGLKVVRQKFQETPVDDRFGQIRIEQSLLGNYSGLTQYLQKILAPESLLLMDRCIFENTSPLDVDPVLTLHLNLSTFYLQP